MQVRVSLFQGTRLPLLVLVAVAAGLLGAVLRPALLLAALSETPLPVTGHVEAAESPPAEPPLPTEPPSVELPAPAAEPKAQPAKARRKTGFVTARLFGSLAVHVRPAGPVVARLGSETEFGSPQVVAVVERRGAWLGVITTALPNNEVGWIRAENGSMRLARTSVSITVDLSTRRLTLRDGKRVLRRIAIGIGNPSSPTPVGRFAVTDKLAGSTYGSYYGCCILALSAHQPNLPPGWTGGDRMAIHGTSDPSSIGAAQSAGCLRAADTDLRALMRRVPLGTPVVIRA
jgi:lipoprotein-anchoring transpeptidase ErfK/SrfK